MRRKVLIVKTGLTELLESQINATVCLGDVLRATILLNYFRDADVDWITSRPALPLLNGNSHISKIYLNDEKAFSRIGGARYHTVINLEKDFETCLQVKDIGAEKRLGFFIDSPDMNIDGYGRASDILDICADHELKRNNRQPLQVLLASLADAEWKGEEYMLGYRPANRIVYDVGFNYETSRRWHNKAWPLDSWKALEKKVSGRYRISWQKGMDNLYDYIDWINSCRLLVTNDSLGLHLALALKRRVVVLYGPSSSDEIHLYGQGRAVFPEKRCVEYPCFNRECSSPSFCMESISPESVGREIDRALAG